MDSFFQGVLTLVVLVVVVMLFAVLISYLYERGIGRPIFDALIKHPAWKKAQFVLVLLAGVAVAHYLGIDVVEALNKFAPLVNSPNPDVSSAITGVLLAVVSSYLHEKTGLNTDPGG